VITSVTIDDEDARRLHIGLSRGFREAEAMMESNKAAIADAASNLIFAEIREIDKIGDFMAARTKIDVSYTGDAIILSVSGMTEEEAGRPSKSGGDGDGKDYNLWEWLENGAGKGEGSKTTYEKDVGGVKATRKKTAMGAPGKYKGAVADALQSVTFQLADALEGVAVESVTNSLSSSIERATRGKVKITGGAGEALRSAGITQEMLAAKAVMRVSVTKTGQIIVLGKNAGGTTGFLSPSALGIPTTIRTS
jgi:hypothetical protein